jgi:hypothetical protein
MNGHEENQKNELERHFTFYAKPAPGAQRKSTAEFHSAPSQPPPQAGEELRFVLRQFGCGLTAKEKVQRNSAVLLVS